MTGEIADIYTDGSCHTQHRIGTWVAIIFTGTEKKILSGIVKDSTHNRMELIAVINAIDYVRIHNGSITIIRVYSDSQYVTGLPARKKKITEADFTTGKKTALQNADLVKTFFELLSIVSIEFKKIKAHQKKENMINYNRDADMLSRKLLRNAVEGIAV